MLDVKMQEVRGIRGNPQPGVREVRDPVELKERGVGVDSRGERLQGGQVIKEHLEVIKVVQEVEVKGEEGHQAKGSRTGRVKMQGPNGEHLEVHKPFLINN